MSMQSQVEFRFKKHGYFVKYVKFDHIESYLDYSKVRAHVYSIWKATRMQYTSPIERNKNNSRKYKLAM